MREFMMIFHQDHVGGQQPTAEQMQATIRKWQDWVGGIAAQGKFVATNALGAEGKTLMPNGVITDGPYTEVKEMIGGYLIIKADMLDEALRLAEGCPIFDVGGKVEVRIVREMERPWD